MSSMEPKFKPEQALKILESVANKHDPSSQEYAAVVLAAKALLFIHSSNQTKAFSDYLEQFDQDLTEEQRRLLAQLGLG